MAKTDKQLKLVSGRIRSMRELRGFSQDYMAHKLNISVSAYSRIERCEVQLTLDKLLQLKEILSTDITTLLEGESNAPGGPLASEALLKEAELNEAYREQISLLKEQVDYLKSMIKKKN